MLSKNNWRKYFSLILCLIIFSPAFGLGEKQPEKPEVISTQKESKLETALKSGLPVIVKLGADWCPPCREMKPVLDELAKELKGKALILDLDIGKNEELANEFKVNLIPTTIFYNKKGKPIGVETGFMSKEKIREKLKDLGLVK